MLAALATSTLNAHLWLDLPRIAVLVALLAVIVWLIVEYSRS